MRPGFLEIGIIIVVAFILFGVTRIMQRGQNTAGKNEKSAASGQQKDEGKTGWLRRPYFGITGIVFIVIGIIILLLGLTVMKWVLWGNIWAFIILAIGSAAIFVARRR